MESCENEGRYQRFGPIAFAVILWLIMAAFLWMSASFNATARLVPVAVSAPTLLLLTIQVARAAKALVQPAGSTEDTHRPAGLDQAEKLVAPDIRTQIVTEQIDDADEGVPESEMHAGSSTLVALGWFGLFAASYVLLGLYVALAVYMVSFLRLCGRERWRVLLPVVGGLALLIRVVLDGMLNVPIYTGLLRPFIRSLLL